MQALIVDDSAAMRHIQRQALEKMGWQVHVAAEGGEALNILRGLPSCDLVLTDWHMPGMDGMELVRAIRKETRHPGVRIVVVSSDGVVASMDKALAAGANDFLIKPFSQEAFSERVNEVMGV